MTNYPAGLDTFPRVTGDTAMSVGVGGETHSELHNGLAAAIEKIETELGTNPSGAYATVAARFDARDAILGTGIEGNAATLAARLAAADQAGNRLPIAAATWSAGTTGGWTASNGVGAYLSGGDDCAGSMTWTASQTATGTVLVSPSVDVDTRSPVTAAVSLAVTGGAPVVAVGLAFYSGGTNTSTTWASGPVEVAAGGWPRYVVTGQVPSGSDSVRVIVSRLSNASAVDVLRVSRAGVWRGSGGRWSAPGGGPIIGGAAVPAVSSLSAGGYVAGLPVTLVTTAGTVSLPRLDGGQQVLRVVNRSSGAVTVSRTGSDTVEGGTSVSMSYQGWIDLVGTGTAWYVIEGAMSDSSVGQREWTWSQTAKAWTQVFGDTGWQTVTSWDAAGTVTGFALGAGCVPTAGQAGGIYIRRVADDVHLRVSYGTVSGGTSGAALLGGVLPSGWRMRSWASVNLRPEAVDSGRVWLSAGNGISVSPSVKTASGSVALPSDGEPARWQTTNSWPTSLTFV